MNQGKLNFIVGGIGLVIFSLGGFALGINHAHYFAEGFYKIDLIRALLKDAHNHGQPFAMLNLIVGLLLPLLVLSERGKAWLSYFTVISLLLPLGLFLRGISCGSMIFAPITFTGGFAFLGAAVLLAVGAWNIQAR